MASAALPAYKAAFLDACMSSGCLTFGDYTLKSGRKSPYYFNAGDLAQGVDFDALTHAFAKTLELHSDPEPLHFDVLFGPAYKGIPLAVGTLKELTVIDRKRFGDVYFSFNRKEAKTHGDGGTIVGGKLKGKRVVIIDDVMTAATAVGEAARIIESQGGFLVGIVVSVDRMEKMPAPPGEDEDAPRGSTITEVRKKYNVPVIAVLTLDDIIHGLKEKAVDDQIQKLEDYRAKYKPSF